MFPGYSIVSRNMITTAGEIDLHLKDQSGNDLLVEFKANRISKRQIGELVAQYMSIKNIEPRLHNPRYVVVGSDIDRKTTSQLKEFGIEPKTYKDLELPVKQLAESITSRKTGQVTSTELRVITKWRKENTSVVTPDSVSRDFGYDLNHSRQVIHNLAKKQWLERVSPGVYVFIPVEYGDQNKRFPPVDAFLIGSKLVPQYYFAYATANSYYGFSGQVPATNFLAVRRQKHTITWREMSFQFVTLADWKFFGYTNVDHDGSTISIAEREKAVVDSVDKYWYAGGMAEVVEVVRRAFKSLDSGKLVEYASKMRSHALSQRLGFLLDFLTQKELITLETSTRNGFLRQIGHSPIYLSWDASKKGTYSREWRVVNNFSDSELLS
jgi:predicted transcriptional regulator of viral defense system